MLIFIRNPFSVEYSNLDLALQGLNQTFQVNLDQRFVLDTLLSEDPAANTSM